MRKIPLLLILGIAVLIAAASAVMVTTPADAARPTNSPRCMSLKEWRKIDEGMTRTEVKQIVGNWGSKGRTTHYDDGTIDFYVEYRQCGRPSYYTTMLAFETEVTYGAYVWDEFAEFVCDVNDDCNWVGAEVWDEYEPSGVTYTPRVRFVGSF